MQAIKVSAQAVADAMRAIKTSMWAVALTVWDMQSICAGYCSACVGCYVTAKMPPQHILKKMKKYGVCIRQSENTDNTGKSFKKCLPFFRCGLCRLERVRVVCCGLYVGY